MLPPCVRGAHGLIQKAFEIQVCRSASESAGGNENGKTVNKFSTGSWPSCAAAAICSECITLDGKTPTPI